MSSRTEAESALRHAHVRPTPRRMAVFDVLCAAKGPASADEIHTAVRSDLATVYRTLETFVRANIARPVHFKDGIIRYERANTYHHHHLVCTVCGRVDELPQCDVGALEARALRSSKHFAYVSEHALEFFGTCRTCAKS